MRGIGGYIEAQSDRLDALLARFGTPGRVVSGYINVDLVTFEFQPAPHVQRDAITANIDVIKAFFPDAELTFDKGLAIVTFRNEYYEHRHRPQRASLPAWE